MLLPLVWQTPKESRSLPWRQTGQRWGLRLQFLPWSPLGESNASLREDHWELNAKMEGWNCPKKRKCKKAKWLSEEALRIAEKRRETKGKGEKDRYTHQNAEFWRRARRDKNAFLSDQCKGIEENNRMGKTRDFFKKIRDTKGTFHAKMDSKRTEMVWT